MPKNPKPSNGSSSSSTPASTSSPSKSSSSGSTNLARRYRATLTALSARTGTALPSLVTSFAILHEVSALVPLVGVFYACRATGVGERAVGLLRAGPAASASASASPASSTWNSTPGEPTWVNRTTERWITEGEAWAGRVGRRYGVFGFEKGAPTRSSSSPHIAESSSPSNSLQSAAIAGDVANALVAYCATKVRVLMRCKSNGG